MLGWAAFFFIIAIIAGLLGFSGVAGAVAGVAQLIFFVFVALFLGSSILGRRSFRGRRITHQSIN